MSNIFSPVRQAATGTSQCRCFSYFPGLMKPGCYFFVRCGPTQQLCVLCPCRGCYCSLYTQHSTQYMSSCSKSWRKFAIFLNKCLLNCASYSLHCLDQPTIPLLLRPWLEKPRGCKTELERRYKAI